MSYGLLAWCAGSAAACAVAGLGTTLLIQEPRAATEAVAVIRTAPDLAGLADPTLDASVADTQPAVADLTPVDDLSVPASLASTASLFGDLPRDVPLRPAFMDVVAEYRPEQLPAATEPQALVREILTEVARSRDLARALVRPPPRPAFASRAPDETDGQAEEAGIEPTAKNPRSVFGLLPGSIFGSSDVSAATSGNAAKPLQSGMASWYGPGFNGRKTASGERFNQNELTAAHRSLPFGTKVKVVDPATGRSVIVRINDRGPYAHGRVIDLSKASAEALGLRGLARVQIVSAE